MKDSFFVFLSTSNFRREWTISQISIRIACLQFTMSIYCVIIGFSCKISSRVINLLLTKLAQDHTGRYWPLVCFVWTLLCSVSTVKTSGHYFLSMALLPGKKKQYMYHKILRNKVIRQHPVRTSNRLPEMWMPHKQTQSSQ